MSHTFAGNVSVCYVFALQAVSGRYYSALAPPLVNCGQQAGFKDGDVKCHFLCHGAMVLSREPLGLDGMPNRSLNRRTEDARQKIVEWPAFRPLLTIASYRRTGALQSW